MQSMLLVGLGGALGAMMRYAISLLPLRSSFPWTTLVINFLGAFFIGFLVGMVDHNEASISKGWMLFLKTGVCGGFTTFSTFSLEAMELLQQKAYVQGCLYIVTSVGLCLLGVWMGKLFAKSVVTNI